MNSVMGEMADVLTDALEARQSRPGIEDWADATSAVSSHPALTRIGDVLSRHPAYSRRGDPDSEIPGYSLRGVDGVVVRDSWRNAAAAAVSSSLRILSVSSKRVGIEEMAAATLSNLEALARALGGDEFGVPHLTEVRNYSVPANCHLRTGFGDLVLLNGTALGSIPHASGPAAFTPTCSIKIGEQPDTLLPRTLLQAAFILADLEPPLFGYESAIWPFWGGIGVSMIAPAEFHRPVSPSPHTLKESKIEHIRAEAQKLENGYHPSLDAAYSRIVRSKLLRGDPAGQLVDAVIAWEAMFGTATETVFRVTASLSMLLEPNAGARIELQRRLKKLYALRSDVVHGRSAPALGIQSAASEACDIALQALRALNDMPDEFRNLGAAERSRDLLLGVAERPRR